MSHPGTNINTTACSCGWSLIRKCPADDTRSSMALRLHQKVCRGIKNQEMLDDINRTTDAMMKSMGTKKMKVVGSHTRDGKSILEYEKINVLN